MKKLYIIILSIIGILNAQDSRSTIFSTGTPDTEEGYVISGNISIADRFSVSSDYAMEAFRVTLAMESIGSIMTVSIHEDNNNVPGSVLGSWDVPLNTEAPRDYTIYTFEDCILFDEGQNYWLSVKASDPLSIGRWVYSPSSLFTYSSSSDGQLSWNTQVGFAGNAKVYAEVFYEPDPLYGDVNLDSQLNVLDVVNTVSYVVNGTNLTYEQINLADINSDAAVNVLDIVQLVNIIVNTAPMSSFSLLDFNPNSEYNGENIGPSFFNGQVSCYYFGKQG